MARPALTTRMDEPTRSMDLSASAARWKIWQLQADAGNEPCFGTSYRLVCKDLDCRYRQDCMRLRADWRR